jgi:three-Cys-motif partner protein
MSVEPEWIQNKVASLREHADALEEAGDEVDNPNYGPWTALKLMVFTAAANVYTNVANGRFDFYYVDAMAGSGVVEVRDQDVSLAGSPILAGTVPRYPFEKMYLIEQDSDRAASLEERLAYATDEIDAFQLDQDEWEVICGDANDILPEIPEMVEEDRGAHPGVEIEGGTKAHHFGFVDNERTEITLSALEQLLDGLIGDLLINYQEVGINRRTGRIEAGQLDEEEWEEIEAFFGTGEVREKESAPERIELYERQVENRLEHNNHRDILIEASEEYPYAYRTIYTAGGSAGFIDFMDNYGENIESLTGDDIGRVIETMEGTGTTLDYFMDDDPGQTEFGDF